MPTICQTQNEWLEVSTSTWGISTSTETCVVPAQTLFIVLTGLTIFVAAIIFGYLLFKK